jgi:hypothetical protein
VLGIWSSRNEVNWIFFLNEVKCLYDKKISIPLRTLALFVSSVLLGSCGLSHVTVDSNRTVVESFFDLQNKFADVNKIRSLFAADYQIRDLADSDVSKRSASNIKERIENFRKNFPGYHITVQHMMAEKNQVFTWFDVSQHKETVLDSFVLFTLDNGKITKAVEMVSLKK